ncbi:UdgX family uracil-DNA binding protein [Burkholderia plantarii]|uniref:UdgX family uracil-DNA binding protein n=1 Tax=Burkholderia plantarii TaxID=41899 RepID=UPI0018DBFE08|nr:UdgX family uracil-DNA binding protein [Burkholderia plantarii]MBI0330876.1 UdgX family uracil-DNA binding protein [Burkholderia plantarii]
MTGPARDRRASEPPARELGACRRCSLWEHATQAVHGEGPRRATLMLVGEQPGDRDDLSGRPFVGSAGHILDRALADADITRAEVYLTNAVKHFKWEPRGRRRLHRPPAQREVEACRHWLVRELDAIGPRVIVALGATALRAVLDDPAATLRRTHEAIALPDGRYVVATAPPSFVLRTRDANSRERAYDELVDALRTARRLVRYGLAHHEPAPGAA